MELPTDEVLLASAINFLFEGQEIYEASLLLLCNVKAHTWNRYDEVTTLMVEIIGNRGVYDILQNEELPSRGIIERAFNAVVPFGYGVEALSVRVDVVNVNSSNWREMMEEVLEGKKALNQCVPIKDREIYYWGNLRFRSPAEIAIAQVLNEYEVLFLPNCMARLGSPKPDERKDREADFLVCYDGKWGIIEVDGETVHTNAARDHDRDRLFRTHRIRVLERFTAKECISDPKLVVRKFLDILKKNG